MSMAGTSFALVEKPRSESSAMPNALALILWKSTILFRQQTLEILLLRKTAFLLSLLIINYRRVKLHRKPIFLICKVDFGVFCFQICNISLVTSRLF